MPKQLNIVLALIVALAIWLSIGQQSRAVAPTTTAPAPSSAWSQMSVLERAVAGLAASWESTK